MTTWMIVLIVLNAIALIACSVGFIFALRAGPNGIRAASAFFMLAAISVPFLVWGICNTTYIYTDINEHVADIISIRRGNEAEGQFFLGAGYIGSTQYYYYYYEAEPNRYKLDKVEASRSYVVEDSTKTPSIYKLKAKGEETYHYDIYVPEGTIVTTFVLN